jgi:hypothetical protein
MATPTPPEPGRSSFENQADTGSQGIVAEFWAYLMHTKKWWVTPILLMLLLLGGLIILGGTGAAPFIYTLF